MRCYDCGEHYIEHKGNLERQDDFGSDKYIVENVTYYECPKCNKILFPDETVRAIELKQKSLSKK